MQHADWHYCYPVLSLNFSPIKSRMKSYKTLTASLLVSIGLVAPLAAQEPKPAAPETKPAETAPAAQSFTDEQVLEAIGWMVGKQSGLFELGFSKEQVSSMIVGLQNAAAGKELGYDIEKIGPAVQKFMEARQQAYVSKLQKEGLEASEKFLTEVKARKGVTTLPSGLAYEILKAGEGAAPKPTDTVRVHYVGTLADGTKFDSSLDNGQPADLGLDRVIPGWTEGMQKIQKGGKIKLYVPPQLGYGEMGSRGIPPNAALVFEVELLDINPTPAPQPAPELPAVPAPGAQPTK